jgi:putative ATP-grasp target RiPP
MSERRYTLHASSEVLPLGRPFGEVDPSSATPSRRRPFGLRFAETCRSVSILDRDALDYDEDQQIGVVHTDDGVVPLARHTDGQTSTVTHSDGRGGNDSDTDHRED